MQCNKVTTGHKTITTYAADHYGFRPWNGSLYQSDIKFQLRTFLSVS